MTNAAPRRPRWAVFVEGVVTIRPATEAVFAGFLDEFLAVEYPLLTAAGIELAGSWRRLGGSANQLLHVYRFASVSAIDESGKAMREHPDHALLGTIYKGVDRRAFRYHRQMGVSLAIAPTTLLDAALGEPSTPPTPFLELRGRIVFGAYAEAYELLERQLSGWKDAGLFELVLGYDLLYGEHGEWAVYGRLPGGAQSVPRLREAVDADVARALGDLTADERSFVLEPTHYSPLR